jgi:glycosyltransferase involved in cell wall biosynthesis
MSSLKELVKWCYFWVFDLAGTFVPKSKKAIDLCTVCFVVPQENKGWILDGIAKDIVKNTPHNAFIHYGPAKIPETDVIVFMHWAMIVPAILRNFGLFKKVLVLHFTHHDPKDITDAELVATLSHIDVTMAMNTRDVYYLKELGLRKPVSYAIGAADPAIFTKQSDRRPAKILLSGQFLERKNPRKLIETIRQNQDMEFCWLGPGWSESEYGSEIELLPNVELLAAPYSEYPNVYAKCGVYLSLSIVEGGPIPLLETMMANLVPVVTDTGFAPDVITHGQNGFLLGFDDDQGQIRDFLKRAITFEEDVSHSVRLYNWKDYSTAFFSEIENMRQAQLV